MTIEQRVAALEAQTPNEYYMSRFKGEEIDAAIARAKAGGELDNFRPGVNILHNWYFANPVNQRGQTEYSGVGYGIDRWTMTHAASKHSILDGYIEFSPGISERYPSLRQFVENGKMYRGFPLTASLLYKNQGGLTLDIALKCSNHTGGGFAVGKSNMVVNDWTLITATGIMYEDGSDLRLDILCDIPQTTASFQFLAAKLELGSVQTLAHQDEDGNWVLNDPPPDPAVELLKCMRYQYVFSTEAGISTCYLGSGVVNSATTARILINFPVPLRTKPSISTDAALIVVSNGAKTVEASKLSFEYAAKSYASMTIQATIATGLTTGDPAMLRTQSADARTIFDANL